MPISKSTQHSRVYLSFKEIEVGEFREIVRYFEDNEYQIRHLEFGENFELRIGYLIALFEIGAYRKYLAKVDRVISSTILHNIKFHKGEDIYHKLLFKKAASHYHLLQYDKSEHILKELIKMNPYDEAVVLLLKKCLRKKHPGFVRHTRAISILFFLFSALLISFEVVLIRSFFPEYTATIMLGRNLLFATGCLILAGGDLFYYIKVSSTVKGFVKFAKQRKLSK